MEMLQKMSTPYARSDDYKPKDDDSDVVVLNETKFPWVMHGAFCLTEQQPNTDGHNKGGPHQYPELHFWAASKAAAAELEDRLKSLKGAKVVVNSSFDSYQAGLWSQEAMKKKPPMRRKKD